MIIEDDGNDSVRMGGVPRCKDLSEALPETHWIRFMPMPTSGGFSTVTPNPFAELLQGASSS